LTADPASLATPPSTFLCRDDTAAKRTVTSLLADLGWPPECVIDIGPLANARWPESLVLMVRPLVAALGPVPFALAIAR
jgi:predicted dinucleotide-binding enzyme